MRDGALSSRATAPSSSLRATALLFASSLRDGAPLLARDDAFLLISRIGASLPPRATAPSSSSESSATALLCLFHTTTCLSLLHDNAPPSHFARRRLSSLRDGAPLLARDGAFLLVSRVRASLTPPHPRSPVQI
ncbi:hypothetical protein C8R44DRAFT_882855 [Mycena epipterygia]|nr:hypothetical protein C8R44DRAFT_882855 [Mycena epipterygia]